MHQQLARLPLHELEALAHVLDTGRLGLRPSERIRAQSANDVIVFITSGTCMIIAAPSIAGIGWERMQYVGFAISGAMLGVLATSEALQARESTSKASPPPAQQEVQPEAHERQEGHGDGVRNRMGDGQSADSQSSARPLAVELRPTAGSDDLTQDHEAV